MASPKPKRIPESFFALKAVDGTYRPPIAPYTAVNYKDLMDHDWHKDPKLGRSSAVKLCRQGWHAFPLDCIRDWWGTQVPQLSRNRGARHIWLVEMSGYAIYGNNKMCASWIRFEERLHFTEVNQLASELLMIRDLFDRGAELLRIAEKTMGLDGLVLLTIRNQSPVISRARQEEVA